MQLPLLIFWLKSFVCDICDICFDYVSLSLSVDIFVADVYMWCVPP